MICERRWDKMRRAEKSSHALRWDEVPSTTLYYKACTKHFPALLCNTKLAQSTSQYYFVLQNLHKALPSTTLYYNSTTLYYEACAKHFPVPLWTTNLAQSTSQYYFGLQTLHKVRPGTTLWYKVCTKKAFTHSKFFRREILHTALAF